MISERVRKLYQRADRISGNRLNILRDAIKTFTVTRANQAAASLAYYIIFSLFPLLLVLISAGGFFLDSQQVYLKVSHLIQQNIPDSVSMDRRKSASYFGAAQCRGSDWFNNAHVGSLRWIYQSGI